MQEVPTTTRIMQDIRISSIGGPGIAIQFHKWAKLWVQALLESPSAIARLNRTRLNSGIITGKDMKVITEQGWALTIGPFWSPSPRPSGLRRIFDAESSRAMFIKISAVFSLSMVSRVSSSAFGGEVSLDQSVLARPSSARSDRYLWIEPSASSRLP